MFPANNRNQSSMYIIQSAILVCLCGTVVCPSLLRSPKFRVRSVSALHSAMHTNMHTHTDGERESFQRRSFRVVIATRAAQFWRKQYASCQLMQCTIMALNALKLYHLLASILNASLRRKKPILVFRIGNLG